MDEFARMPDQFRRDYEAETPASCIVEALGSELAMIGAEDFQRLTFACRACHTVVRVQNRTTTPLNVPCPSNLPPSPEAY